MRRALILGVGGQDGSYLADILLERGYEVYGLYRRSSTNNLSRINHIKDRIVLFQGDLLDPISIIEAINTSQPHEIYNVADQDHVGWSHNVPFYNYQVTFAAVGNLFELILRLAPEAKVFQPVSATMFEGQEVAQTEESKITPRSPYACAKAGAFFLAQHYRRRFNLFISTGILYNHDSPRRGPEYLLQRIASQAKDVRSGKLDMIYLWDLDGLVDIGYAREYMEGAVSMLQLAEPDDFILATGAPKIVLEVAAAALRAVKSSPDLIKETGKDRMEGYLVGNITKARKTFGFEPKHNAESLVRALIRGELS